MPATSKSQARFMRAVASGKVKKKGLSRKEAEEFVSGYSTKDLPEKARKSMGKKNATVAMRVEGIRAVSKDKVCVELTSEKPSKDNDEIAPYSPFASSARLCMSRKEAEHYPVGSMVAIHCLPAGDAPVAKMSKEKKRESMAEEALEEYEMEDEE